MKNIAKNSKWKIGLIGACIAILIASCLKNSKEIPHQKYSVKVIHDNYDSTLNVATKADKNICLMLHAPWCKYCNKFIGDVLTDSSVKNEIGNKIIVGLINGDSDYGKKYYKQYMANGYPTFLILDNKGMLINKKPGSQSKDEFIDWIKNYYK